MCVRFASVFFYLSFPEHQRCQTRPFGLNLAVECFLHPNGSPRACWCSGPSRASRARSLTRATTTAAVVVRRRRWWWRRRRWWWRQELCEFLLSRTSVDECTVVDELPSYHGPPIISPTFRFYTRRAAQLCPNSILVKKHGFPMNFHKKNMWK